MMLITPLAIVISLAAMFSILPAASGKIMDALGGLFVGRVGSFYILMGIFAVICCAYVACSKYGETRLGDGPPEYGNFRWGAMIFTSTMAADILYWSLIEWGYYYSSNPMGAPELSGVQRHLLASAYPLFHWGPIPWAFYILPAAAYAHMFYVSGRSRQTLSEACRPIIGSMADGRAGRAIDIFSVVGLLAGTATTFSLATPLMAEAVGMLSGVQNTRALTILLLCVTGAIFTAAVITGLSAISKLAVFSVWSFAAFTAYVFLCGPSLFMIESGLSGLGYAAQHFIEMATWTDPLRMTGSGSLGFPQQWTIFYWAYWIAWFVATPFFIAKISKGRTIRQMIGGAFIFGLSGTYISFIVFGNFGLHQQASGIIDVASALAGDVPPPELILRILSRLPLKDAAAAGLVVVMIALYASTFDAITLVVAGFCKKNPASGEQPEAKLRAIWALVFIILPISLVYSDSTLRMLQTLSILAAFPLALIMLIIVAGFLKELKAARKQEKTQEEPKS
jgi:BCCT family betaine/carnitine transporter